MGFITTSHRSALDQIGKTSLEAASGAIGELLCKLIEGRNKIEGAYPTPIVIIIPSSDLLTISIGTCLLFARCQVYYLH